MLRGALTLLKTHEVAHEPTYEGRPLARPHDGVVDQGLGFDLGTLLSRRRALWLFGAGAAGAALTACTGDSGGTGSGPSPTATASGSLGEIPGETAGPFPGDGSNGPDILEQSGVVRSDIRSSFGGAGGTAEGVPMTLELVIKDLASGAAPFTGAAVYVWHCDRAGGYSLYSSGVENENYLRGVQVADGDGRVRFTSIFPACYPGRWPHVHFEVFPDRGSITDAGNVLAISQVALPRNACDAAYAQPGYEQSVSHLRTLSPDSDSVFSDDGGRSQLATVSGDVDDGYTATLDVGVRS